MYGSSKRFELQARAIARIMKLTALYYIRISAIKQGQQRTIRQANSTRDFSSRQGLKSAGILYVFQAFQTAGLAEKIRRSVQAQLRGVDLKKKIGGIVPW